MRSSTSLCREIIRKHIDSDLETLALDEMVFSRTSTLPAHHHPTTLYYALVHGLRADFILAFPAAAGDCLFERRLRIALGSSNCERHRRRTGSWHVRLAGDYTRRSAGHRAADHVGLFTS